MMPREQFDEFVNEFLEKHGGIEEAVEVAMRNIEKTQRGFHFKNGNSMEGFQGQTEFWVEVLDELHYRIAMN